MRGRIRRPLLSGIISIIVGTSALAHAGDSGERKRVEVQVVPLHQPSGRGTAAFAAQMEISTQKVEPLEGSDYETLRFYLFGVTTDPDFSYLCNSPRLCSRDFVIRRSPKGLFSLPIRIRRGSNEPLRLLMIDPFGRAIEKQFQITVSGWDRIDEVNRTIAQAPASSRGRLRWGLAATAVRYTEPPFADQSETALTFQFGYDLPLGSDTTQDQRWTLSFHNYLTVLTVKEKQEPPMRFLGLNARAGYRFSPRESPWAFSLYGGLSYHTSFVERNVYGYSNLLSLQLYPQLVKQLSGDRRIGIYVKVSPIFSGASFLPLENRELASGLSYTWRTRGGHDFSIVADVSQLTFSPPEPILGMQIRSETKTFSLGFMMPIDGFTSGTK